MRTQDPKSYKPDYALLTRLSIQRDFRNANVGWSNEFENINLKKQKYEQSNS